MRKLLAATCTAAFLLLTAASAQAHYVLAKVSCGTVTFTWYEMGTGSANGGFNTPEWSYVFTPAGGGPTSTGSGNASFHGASGSATTTFPAANGSIFVESHWDATTTNDGDVDHESETLPVTGCTAPVQPTITTTASPSTLTVGSGSIKDSAVLAGGSSPTGTITFSLYGPGDTTCTTAIYTSPAVTVAGAGTYISPAYTPTAPGTYQWIARYSGDGKNNPVADACGTGSEANVVTKANPQINTQASPGVTVGSSISDTATLTGGDNPTGSITFKLYGPNDLACGTPVYVSPTPVAVNGDATYPSPSYTPTTPGNYQWIAIYSGDANNAGTQDACNLPAEQTVVSPNKPSITTQASPSLPIGGGPLSDTATLSGGTNPTGTITFTLYGPNDNSCTHSVFTSGPTIAVHGDNTYPSPTYTPTAPGTYQWIASYSGDANNQAAADACNLAPEQTVVSPATPQISTTASGTIVLGSGGKLTDTANLTGGYSLTGTIVFKLYGPGDSTCSTALYTSSAVNVAGAGSYSSPSPGYTPTAAGSYQWIASYSGDANNKPVADSCNASGEATVVTSPGQPSVTTTATPSAIVLGASMSDSAVLAGGNNPTGTITFNVYGPGDSTCANSLKADTVSVNGDNTYPGPSFTPTAPGTYVWVASYSGDANNSKATDGCNAANESVVVSPSAPKISTQASAGPIQLGSGSISDQATLTGGSSPTGTITFKVYGPGDSTCATPLGSSGSSPVTIAGDGTYNSPSYTPTKAGTYTWVATYSGDANNKGVSDSCLEPSEQTVVSPNTPKIVTQVAAATVGIGASISDSATLSGATNPTGTITFSVFGPGDSTCTTALKSGTVTVTGNTTYQGPSYTPLTAGTYQWVATYSGDTNNPSVSDGCNAANEQTTVTSANPTITTQASATLPIGGGPLSDKATLSGGNNPTGSIKFTLYSSTDTTCTSPLFTSNPAVTISGDGTYSSPTYTPTAPGTYQWVATYSGDVNNASVSDACNEPAEQTVVTPAKPTITTQASATLPIGGGPLSDTATLSGGVNPTGTITFALYSSTDTSCTSPLFTSNPAVTISGDGKYSSPTYTPTAPGIYQWVATYNGDVNNATATDGCNQPAEQTNVTPANPAITTQASAGIVLGSGSLQDKATLTGGTTPTGKITFALYGPNNGTCSGTPIATGTVTANGDNTYTGPSYTPTSAGVYQWVASYSGDANNASATDGCNAANEQTTVTQPSPSFIIQKLQEIVGGPAGYTSSPITAVIGSQISYQINVINTGGIPLSLAVTDPHCDNGTLTGPTPAPAGGLLAPGAETHYFCTHVVLEINRPTWPNTVYVTATPPGQPPLPTQQYTVIANIPAGGQLGACVQSSTPTLHGPTSGVTKPFTVRVSGAGLKSVTFKLDGHTYKTLTHQTGGKFVLTIDPSKLSFGGHRLSVQTTPSSAACLPVGRAIEFVRAKAATIIPKFTG